MNTKAMRRDTTHRVAMPWQRLSICVHTYILKYKSLYIHTDILIYKSCISKQDVQTLHIEQPCHGSDCPCVYIHTYIHIRIYIQTYLYINHAHQSRASRRYTSSSHVMAATIHGDLGKQYPRGSCRLTCSKWHWGCQDKEPENERQLKAVMV